MEARKSMGTSGEVLQPECMIWGRGGERHGVVLEVGLCTAVEGTLQWPG